MRIDARQYRIMQRTRSQRTLKAPIHALLLLLLLLLLPPLLLLLLVSLLLPLLQLGGKRWRDAAPAELGSGNVRQARDKGPVIRRAWHMCCERRKCGES